MKVYKFRAERIVDVFEFLKVCAGYLSKVGISINYNNVIREPVVQFKTDDIKCVLYKMKSIVDGHVMVETLNIREQYTGERTYNDKSWLSTWANSPYVTKRLNVSKYLNAYDISYQMKMCQNGKKIYVLTDCPFYHKFRYSPSAIIQSKNGTLSFTCHDNDCDGKKWMDLRQKISGNNPIHKFME